MTNQMGNVIAITDDVGDIVIVYRYDEWGNVVSTETLDEDNETQIAVANTNPIRYRGYYYDNETGYYYLQSRYYDPSICRFINTDLPDVVRLSKYNQTGINFFAYCNNDPVNNCDPFGTWKMPNWAKATIGVFALAGAIGLTLLSGGSLAPLLISVAISTASGAIIGYFKNGKQGVIEMVHGMASCGGVFLD